MVEATDVPLSLCLGFCISFSINLSISFGFNLSLSFSHSFCISVSLRQGAVLIFSDLSHCDSKSI